MSRRGTKTINLPVSLVEVLDSYVGSSVFPVPLSRDEFVRHAITILLIGVEDLAAGRRALAKLQTAIEELPNLRARPAEPKQKPPGGHDR
jgi:Arc/MetJ-type ribon-helix-helix transcriptional regulator